MEAPERQLKPSLKIKELINILDKIKWENRYRFSFNGTEFILMITPKKELIEAKAKGKLKEFGPPAEFFASTYVNWFDIYLHDTISEKNRKRVLFHEILEANLQDQQIPETEAHKIALREEEKVFGARELYLNLKSA